MRPIAQLLPGARPNATTVEDVARRFGLTVRFVEGRLRLATLAPAAELLHAPTLL